MSPRRPDAVFPVAFCPHPAIPADAVMGVHPWGFGSSVNAHGSPSSGPAKAPGIRPLHTHPAAYSCTRAGCRVGPGSSSCVYGATSATSSISHSRPSTAGVLRPSRHPSRPARRRPLRPPVSSRHDGMPRIFDGLLGGLAWPPRIARAPTAIRGGPHSPCILLDEPIAGPPRRCRAACRETRDRVGAGRGRYHKTDT
jgi:hypothetical protein